MNNINLLIAKKLINKFNESKTIFLFLHFNCLKDGRTILRKINK